jgi:hypothetical protein
MFEEAKPTIQPKEETTPPVNKFKPLKVLNLKTEERKAL